MEVVDPDRIKLHPKLTWQCKNNHENEDVSPNISYPIKNSVIFHCHVSFQGCKSELFELPCLLHGGKIGLLANLKDAKNKNLPGFGYSSLGR